MPQPPCSLFLLAALCLSIVPEAVAQPSAKVPEVPKSGLVVDGALTKTDPTIAALRGAPYRVVSVRLVKGEFYVAELTSKHFDTVLMVANPAGRQIAMDNNGAGGTNSRIRFQARSGGIYQLAVASINKKTGAYQLKVAIRKPTPEEKQSAEAARLIARCYKHYQNGEHDKAIAALNQALKIQQTLYNKTKYPDGHHNLATTLNDSGVIRYKAGRTRQAIKFFQQAVAMRRKLHPEKTHPNGHVDLLTALANLGDALEKDGRAHQGLPLIEEALAMARKLVPKSKYPDGHPLIAHVLYRHGEALLALRKHAQAIASFERCLAIRRKFYPASRYPNGHLDVARTHNTLGIALLRYGHSARSVKELRQALAIKLRMFPKSRYPDGHSEVTSTLMNLGAALNAMGEFKTALPVLEQSLKMSRMLQRKSPRAQDDEDIANCLSHIAAAYAGTGRLEKAFDTYQKSLQLLHRVYPKKQYPKGHPNLASMLNNTGSALERLGQLEKGVDFLKRALAMRRQLLDKMRFPEGDPDIALNLNAIGMAFLRAQKHEQALPWFRQALKISRIVFPRSRFPNGHEYLAGTLNNVGMALRGSNRAKLALPVFVEALAMYRRLYPTARFPGGHPRLATSLNNLGGVYLSLGRYDKALALFAASTKMDRKLYPVSRYPDGHMQLAKSISNYGGALRYNGRLKEALPLFEECLVIQQKQLSRELLWAAGSAAFEKLTLQPQFRDAYLSTSRDAKVPADRAYANIWPSRSIVTRVLAQRHAAAQTAGTGAAEKLERLRFTRKRLDAMLREQNRNVKDRDTQLAGLSGEIDRLERELIREVPALKRWRARDVDGPKRLAQALPRGHCFVDLILHMNYSYKKNSQGRIVENREFIFTAFVVSAGTGGGLSVHRVQLGSAVKIEEAISNWRRTIERDAQATADQILARILWKPLAKAIPAGTKVLYLAADGDLARLPWAALPIARGSVLLEKYAVALVPHGAFLLKQLQRSRRKSNKESILTMGGVDYRPSKWTSLPGTAREVASIERVALFTPTTLSKDKATIGTLLKALPKATYAHLATHGEFKAKELVAAKVAAERNRELRDFGETAHSIAAKNPLAYVGLVLAKGEILSGLSILDLPLQKLKLVTLSACETGLGESTGGEGVQGLQRAFHLAGCPNVVASLWQVNDESTAALMSVFYHELWIRKRPPIEALRNAQLYLYYNPAKVQSLARRGPPKTGIVVRAPKAKTGTTRPRRAATRHWAAFVLSGAGQMR